MATGGIFQLITNDGKQDRMLMATGFRDDRIQQIIEANAKSGRTVTRDEVLAFLERNRLAELAAESDNTTDSDVDEPDVDEPDVK